MAFSIHEGPVYGGNRLVVDFGDDIQLHVEASFYIVYEGSQKRHVTSARRLTANKLHSIVPGHNEAEGVRVAVFSYLDGERTLLATNNFRFHNDGAFFLSQFLVDSVFNPQILEDLELIKSDHFDLANEDTSTLDQRLSRAFSYLDFPDWWSLLGADAGQAQPQRRETLLHFAARLGLTRVAGFLISKPGSQSALRLTNRQGNLPKDVAFQNDHFGLAELLAEYNSPDVMPLGHWFDTEEGQIQTQETGDISFTSQIQRNNNRTLDNEEMSQLQLEEEDITLLKEIQQRIEETDASALRQWQTHWPQPSQLHTDNDTNLDNILDRKVENICQKAQELPNIVAIETRDLDPNNTNDVFSEPNLSGEQNNPQLLEGQTEEDGVAMETLPELHISEESLDQEDDHDLMEGSVSALREYNEHLQRIREKGVVFKRILDQDLRKENLARFSSSCPSLDADGREPPLPTIDEDTCKSMLDLVKDGDRPTTGSTGSVNSEDLYSSSGNDDINNVHILVDGTTVGESDDNLATQQTQEHDAFLKEYYGGNVPNVRRRSFSPTALKRQEVDDDDGGRSQTQDEMLGNRGKRSVSFTSLDREREEETDEEESFQDASEMRDTSDQTPPGESPKGRKRAILSTGDIEDISNDEQNSSHMEEDGSSTADASSTSSIKRSGKKGRGQPGSVRYSADIEHLMKRHQAQEGSMSIGGSLDDRNRPATPQSDNSTEEEGGPLSTPGHSKMTKALSTSSIPAATRAEGLKGMSRRGFNRESKQQDAPSHMLIQRLIAEHDAQFRRQAGIEEEGGVTSPLVLQDTDLNRGRMRRKGQVSLIDFLNDPGTFPSSDALVSPTVPKEKEEKKRKISMFSRFHNSVRTKKGKEKENKSKSTHQFVPVSFSNNTQCDVCSKTLANKAALKCEVCMLNVHESQCKEQIAPCGKYRTRVPGLHGDSDGGSGAGLEKNGVSYLRPTNSFKEKSHVRPSSAYVGSSTAQLPITPETQGDQLTSLQTPRRSLPTSNRVITEEGEQDGEPGLDLGHQTNITSNLSQSIESLDETDSVGYAGCDDNELGMLATEEPETWSCTADKKVLKRMNAKDIKRQDTIWELIQTERHHCKHLKILQRFYRDDMINDLKLTPKWVDQLFPRLDELIDIHMSFLRQLQDLQNKRPDHTIDEIGPVLEAQFSGESSDRMKEAYGAFCSGHLMAVQQYKEMLAKDRNFYIFIRKRADHIWCQKREIPDFILLITQRPTKYPTLVEAIIKSTKDKRDKDFLQRALINSKAVLHTVNERVAEAELQMRLQEIYAKTDTRSTGMKAGKKFKKYDLTGNSRRLLYEASMGWRNARGKYTDVIMLVLTDVIVFMQESNQKYVFFSQDNKFGVVSLFNLLVREKGDTRDSKGMYLISQNKQVPEMYELICRTASERLECIKKLRAALHQCPEEEDDVPTEAEEEKRKMEERNQRAKLIMESLQRKDEEIKAHCEEKNKLMLQLFSIYSGADELANTNSRPNSRDFDDAFEQSGTLQAAINEVSNAASQLTSMLQGSSNNLGRSVSSVGEYTSHGFTALPIPKRAETFAGSDTAYDLQKISKRRGIDTGDASESPGSSVYQADSECDLTQCADLPGPSKYDPSDVESGRGSSPGALSSISALSPGSGPGLEQSSLTQLLKTLNSIIYLTASQGTAVESLRAQLSEANERINKLSVDVHEKKSSGYRHNQLEELRNLQGQVQKEKQEWELQKDRESQKLEHERACFDELRRSLEQQEAEIRAQKEDLRKQREVLQKQTDMLQAQGKLPRNASVSGVDTSDQGIVQSNNEH